MRCNRRDPFSNRRSPEEAKMPEDTPFKVRDDLLFGACASGVKEALIESGLLAEFGEALATLHKVKLMKEGLLTAQQAADMLGVCLRTFKRQVKAGMWPEIRIMGSQEYRYPFPDMVALMNLRKHRKAAKEEEEIREAKAA